jgi:hypothetical protein
VWSQGACFPYPACPAGMAGVDAPTFTRYARAGTVGYSMITGCSPRYSRVTTRDHDFGLPGHPRRGWEREGWNNRGNTDHATRVSAKHQRRHSDGNQEQITGHGTQTRHPGHPAWDCGPRFRRIPHGNPADTAKSPCFPTRPTQRQVASPPQNLMAAAHSVALSSGIPHFSTQQKDYADHHPQRGCYQRSG